MILTLTATPVNAAPAATAYVAPPVWSQWKGNWSSTTIYAVNDAVYAGFSSWISLVAANTNNAPAPGSSDWQVIAPGVDPSALAAATTSATASAASASASSTAAAGSAATATTQAGLASAGASTATTEAGIATSAAASTLAALHSFNSAWLGSKSSDPSVDNNGNALVSGAEYFNTTENKIRVYSTSGGWADYDAAAQTDVTNAALSATNAAASAAAAAGTLASAAPKSLVVTPAYATPYEFSATAGTGGDDTASLQAAVNKLLAQNVAGGERSILDLRGGTFRVSSAITLGAGSPYNIGIYNGSIIPYGSYSGYILDFSETTTFTNLELAGLTLNGYDQVTKLINLGANIQGITIRHNWFFGFTQHGIYGTSTAAGTAVRITENVFQGGASGNSGTAIELGGNDGEIRFNYIYNVVVGIKLNGGSWTIALNHIFPISAASPICLIYLNGVGEIQILGNYLDDGYIYFYEYSAQNQVNDNRFLFNGGAGVTMKLPVSGAVVPFSPIVLAPTSVNYDHFDFTVLGNNFLNTAGTYTPVYVDTTSGTIGSCQGSYMSQNGFSGYTPKYTHPVLKGTVSAATSVVANFANSIPWGSIQNVTSILMPGLTSFSISGDSVTLNMAAITSPYAIVANVNGNSATDGN